MRKQIVLLAKKMTVCGLVAAMLFGFGPFDKVTTSKSSAADESYTYLYADLNWAEYWAAEDVYLKDGKNMTDSNETEDARGELDKGAFDAVSRATTNHGLHRGSFQCDAVITADNGQNYPVSYWEQDKDKNQSFYTTDGQKIGYAKGVMTLPDASTTKVVSYTVTGIKYVPVAVKTADLQDFKSKYKVVENGEKLVGGYSENALSSYEETASVTENTNGLKIAAKQADGSYTFGKRKTGTDSGVKDVSLAKASKTVASVVTDEKKKGSYGEFLRVDINSEDGAAANEGYGPLGSRMQAVKWTYYGTDSTRTKAIASYGTKFAADNWMHKSMGIQLGLTESYRSELPSGTDGTGYWNVTIYGLGYEDASYDVEVTKDGISENVTPSEAVDTSKLQGLVDDLHSPLYLTLLVGILDAQQEAAVIALCHQIGKQCGAQVSHVHIAGGAGGKTGADMIELEHKYIFLYYSKYRIGFDLYFYLYILPPTPRTVKEKVRKRRLRRKPEEPPSITIYYIPFRQSPADSQSSIRSRRPVWRCR